MINKESDDEQDLEKSFVNLYIAGIEKHVMNNSAKLQTGSTTGSHVCVIF